MTNILVVDSNANTGFRLKKIFEGHEIGFTNVSSANEAITRLHKNYDIIIIDINLGPDDGFEVIKRIQEHNSTSTVIITTSTNTRRAFVRGIRLGASDYILKPYEDTYIKGKILKHIKDIESNVPKNTAVVEGMIYKHVEKAIKSKSELLVGMIVVYSISNPMQQIIRAPLIKGLFSKIEKSVFSTDLLGNSRKYTGESTGFGVNGKVYIIDGIRLSDKENVVQFIKNLAKNQLNDSEYGFELEFLSLPHEINPDERILETLSKRIEESLMNISE